MAGWLAAVARGRKVGGLLLEGRALRIGVLLRHCRCIREPRAVLAAHAKLAKLQPHPVHAGVALLLQLRDESSDIGEAAIRWHPVALGAIARWWLGNHTAALLRRHAQRRLCMLWTLPLR